MPILFKSQSIEDPVGAISSDNPNYKTQQAALLNSLDAIIVCEGFDGKLEGENIDRTFALPSERLQMITTATRTGVPVNHYYRTKNGTVQGVDFIYSLSGGSFGDTFQAKAVNYVVNTLGIPYADVQAFQNNMLEDLN